MMHGVGVVTAAPVNALQAVDQQQAMQAVLAARAREVLADPQRRARYDIPSCVLPPKTGCGVDHPFAQQLQQRAHFGLPQANPCQNMVLPVEVSLREIYEGATATVTTWLRVPSPPGGAATALLEASFTVEVERGALPGTRYLFHGAGHQDPGRPPGGVELVLRQRPHPRFARGGEHMQDLVMDKTVTLREALLGCTVQVATLDDRLLRVAITDIVRPGYERRLHGEGLPRPAGTTAPGDAARGELVLRLHVQFPVFLPRQCRPLLDQALRPLEYDPQQQDVSRGALAEAIKAASAQSEDAAQKASLVVQRF